MKSQVFLGGACGATTWRRDIAIPALEAAGISYYDPQLAMGEWSERYESAEMQAKAEADILLFVLTGQTRGVATVGEIAYYMAAGRLLALAISDVSEDACFDGRPVGRAERDDLNRGRIFVRTMAREQRVPVFTKVIDAVEHAIELAHGRNQELSRKRLEGLLGEVSFPGGSFDVEEIAEGFLVRFGCVARCVETGGEHVLFGRKWHLARTAGESEVVRTALKAVLTWQEHEVREQFRYRGKGVFSPHLPVINGVKP